MMRLVRQFGYLTRQVTRQVRQWLDTPIKVRPPEEDTWDRDVTRVLATVPEGHLRRHRTFVNEIEQQPGYVHLPKPAAALPAGRHRVMEQISKEIAERHRELLDRLAAHDTVVITGVVVAEEQVFGTADESRQVLTEDTVVHEGATDTWSPLRELEAAAPTGHLDEEERYIHNELNRIEMEFTARLNDMMRVIANQFGMSPADQLVLAGVN